MNPYLKNSLFILAASIVVYLGFYISKKDKGSFNWKNQALYQGFVFLVAEFFVLFIKSPDIQTALVCGFVVAGAIGVEKYNKKKLPEIQGAMAYAATGNKKKKDDELPWTVGVCGLFTVVFIILAACLARWKNMDGWMIAGVIAITGLLAFSWSVVLTYWKDPNKNFWRGICIAVALAGIALIMGHRGDVIGKAPFLEPTEASAKA